jgi:prepilin-type N-terminal cleavage/methylation domain-containing protein
MRSFFSAQNNTSEKNAGFTLIELIVAVTIMAILSSFGIAGFISYSRSQSLNTATQDFVTALQSAKAATASQVKPTSCASTGVFQGYQVNIISSSNSNSYTVGPVCGGVYDTASSRTTILPASSNVTFSNISNLTITFEPITGVVRFSSSSTNDYRDIVLRESQSNPAPTKTVRIYSDGRINVL